MAYILTKEDLYRDLYFAFDCAKKHKSNKPYVKEFESNLDANLMCLVDDLYYRRYSAEPSFCFIIDHPKKREVFAARFRDRIVHHLYFNYTHNMFERTFIDDCYSCVKNKGTSYGIKRLVHHIKSESNNWRDKVYILKLDIKGYFMSINRNKLCDFSIETLEKMRHRRVDSGKIILWSDILDFDFLFYLTKEITLLDVTKSCTLISPKSKYEGLPASKSLFNTPLDCGLPIGNLTSQLFSNIYLNKLDQFVKRRLKAKHYGRYVDDLFIVSKNKQYLKFCIVEIEKFLNSELGLSLQRGKIHILDSNCGVEFLGGYIKPFRIYVSNQCVVRMKETISKFHEKHFNSENRYHSINSLLGFFKHYSSFVYRKNIFYDVGDTGYEYNDDFTKYFPIKN